MLRRLCINVRTWFLLDPLERVYTSLLSTTAPEKGRLYEYGSEFEISGDLYTNVGPPIGFVFERLPLNLLVYHHIVFIKITIVVFPMYPSLDKPNCWDTPQNHQHLRSLGRPSAFSSQVHNIVTLLSGTAFIKTSK